MKIFPSCLVFFVLGICSIHCQNVHSVLLNHSDHIDQTRTISHGAVKFVSIENYRSEEQVELTSAYLCWFDTLGRKIEEIIDPNGNNKRSWSYRTYNNIVYKHQYRYDKSGNLVEKVSYTKDHENAITREILLERWNRRYHNAKKDSSGQIVDADKPHEQIQLKQVKRTYIEKLINASYSKLSSRTSYEYDEEDNLIKEIRYDSSDYTLMTTENSYDKSSNLTEEMIYNDDHTFGFRTVNSYDNKGLLVKKVYYNIRNGKASSKNYYEYDDDGSLILETINKSNDILKRKIQFSYDSGGNLVKRTLFNPENESVKTQETFYNDQNMVESDIWYNEDGSIETKSRYNHIYDEKGNWVKMTSYNYSALELELMRPGGIIVRTIEYF